MFRKCYHFVNEKKEEEYINTYVFAYINTQEKCI